MNDLRRQFELPALDREFVERRHRPWEAVIEGDVRWLVLHEHAVGPGYNHARVAVALQLPQSYPDTQIDMVYLHPCLALTTGRPVRQLFPHEFDGKSWQGWSRHRTNANPWRRGYDCVETHVMLVDEWIEREVRMST